VGPSADKSSALMARSGLFSVLNGRAQLLGLWGLLSLLAWAHHNAKSRRTCSEIQISSRRFGFLAGLRIVKTMRQRHFVACCLGHLPSGESRTCLGFAACPPLPLRGTTMPTAGMDAIDALELGSALPLPNGRRPVPRRCCGQESC
jgi:hypothetical protein